MDKQSTDMEFAKILQLARMVNKRKHVSPPDVNEEWQRFRSDNINVRKVKMEHRWLRTVAAVLCGAAAMFVGFIVYIQLNNESNSVVVLNYDEKSVQGQVTLVSNNGDVRKLTADSISFLSSRTVTENIDKNAPADALARMRCVSTPRGMDFKVILNDGTEVWLNAESKISFPSAFIDGERKVSVEGEAYFKVVRDEERPFIVNVDGKDVRVLGTEFNVRNYTHEYSQVALVKGSVMVCNEGTNTCTMLKPGQDAVWSDNGKVEVHEIDTYSITQWIDGLFYFDEQPLAAILREIGRWYNYGVVFKNNGHTNYKMHFSASKDDTIEHVIDDLNLICGFKLAVEDKNIVVY